jgi:hypothetical protein
MGTVRISGSDTAKMKAAMRHLSGSGRGRLLLAVLLVAGLVAAFGLWPGESEPTYQGKKLHWWLARCTTAVYVRGDMQDPVALEAREAVLQIGTNAIPTLLEWMPGPRQPLRTVEAVRSRLHLPFLGTYRVLGFLRSYSPTDRHTMAVYGFSILGERASQAVPDLTRLLNDPNTVHDAIPCLARMGKPGLDQLLVALGDTNQMDRPYIAAMLGSLANTTNETKIAAALQPWTQAADPELASAALRALREMPPRSTQPAPAPAAASPGDSPHR